MEFSRRPMEVYLWGLYLGLGSKMEAQKGFVEYTVLVAAGFCSSMPVGHSPPGRAL